MSPQTVAFYVSGHGYGHASRQAALIAELRRQRPDLRLLVRSQAPAWLLAPHKEASCKAVAIDPIIAQTDGFTVDREATLRRHERFSSEWDGRVEREAAFLRREKASLVVSDIAALAFASAARVGAPSVGIGNFSWDAVLAGYGERRLSPIIELYRGAYEQAGEFFRLPMHMEAAAFPKVTDCPLLARRSALPRREARRALGLPQDGRPIVLASFGGMGHGPLDFSAADDLSGFVFTGFGPAPRGLKAQWLSLAHRSPTAALDGMSACDVALAKPGYGVLSEALAHGRPAVLISRRDFVETPVLMAAFQELGAAVVLAEEDFRRGRWRAALESALAVPRKAPVPCGGAAFLARRLASLLE